jgi:hypothetical protein
MNEIGILEDKEDQFMQEVVKKLRERGYPVEYIALEYQEIPRDYKYRIIVDRISFQDNYLRTMIKNYSLKGTYVINNPFTNICDDKITEYNMCQKLGVPYPKTYILPKENIDVDTSEEIKLPQLDNEPLSLNFPLVLKPHDGYAWQDVFVVNNMDEFKKVYYEHNKKEILLAQEYVTPKTYYRVYAFRLHEPLFVRYLPSERKYVVSDYEDIKDIYDEIKNYTNRLNNALDYDLNAFEWAIDENNKPWLIDAFNETPDIQPHELPHDYYWKIIDIFVEIIEKRYHSFDRNRWPFEYSP